LCVSIIRPAPSEFTVYRSEPLASGFPPLSARRSSAGMTSDCGDHRLLQRVQPPPPQEEDPWCITPACRSPRRSRKECSIAPRTHGRRFDEERPVRSSVV
jgi:hypothetical protein